MNTTQFLVVAWKSLMNSSNDSLKGTSLEELQETVKNFAISSAIAGGVAGAIPGASIVACLAQTGIVWTMYVKINKQLGISMSKSTMKFIGSAMLTNIISNAGSLLVGYAGATILSIIPILGQITGPLVGTALGYIVIYVSAVLYLNLLTKVFKAKGSFTVDESDEIKEMIKDVVNESDVKGIIKEGQKSFKTAKKNGEIDKAKEHVKCPSCGVNITMDQKYCSNCGAELK